MNNSIAITSNTIVFSSMKLLFLVSNSFMNFAYVDIWSKVSVKWILICNLLRISRNVINYLYSFLMQHVDKVNPELEHSSLYSQFLIFFLFYMYTRFSVFFLTLLPYTQFFFPYHFSPHKQPNWHQSSSYYYTTSNCTYIAMFLGVGLCVS